MLSASWPHRSTADETVAPRTGRRSPLASKSATMATGVLKQVSKIPSTDYPLASVLFEAAGDLLPFGDVTRSARACALEILRATRRSRWNFSSLTGGAGRGDGVRRARALGGA